MSDLGGRAADVADGRAAIGPGVTTARSPWRRVGPWLRGEPLHVPSHALVIHFPAALLPISLVLDIAGRVAPGLDLERATVALLVFGLLGAGLAGATGLLDWIEMLPGPRRDRVTRHMLVQLAAVTLFAASLVIRLADGGGAVAPVSAIGVSAVGAVLLAVGDHLGGLLVYRDGMRVRSGRSR